MLRRSPGAPTRVPTSGPGPVAPPAPTPMSRRALLRRTGLVAAAPAVVTVTGGLLAGSAVPAAAAPAAPAAQAAGTECLADLIEQGTVSRADLLA